MKNNHELRINDPKALVTTRGTYRYDKSDVIEMGVNTFIPAPNGMPVETLSQDRPRASLMKRGVATLAAALALSPMGLVRSSETTSHVVEAPIRYSTTVTPYDWNKTSRGSQADRREAEKAADGIDHSVATAEDAAHAQVPAGATVTNEGSVVDMTVTGGTDDSHNVGPASDNENLGEKDNYNTELGKERAEMTKGDILYGTGMSTTINHTTTDQKEHVLTPAEIKLGDQMAHRYGYDDFDELIQAVGHNRAHLNTHDKKAYDRMITNARVSTIDVNGKVTVAYDMTKDGKDVIAIPNLLPGISTEEHATTQHTQWGPPVRLSKKEQRGRALPRQGSAVRKIGGSTFRGSRHGGAFLPNSR